MPNHSQVDSPLQWVSSISAFQLRAASLYLFILDCLYQFTGQHGHLSGGLHPAHTHMHGGWYTGMGALGASSSLQSGFASAGSLGGGVVPHSQSYHLGLNSMVRQKEHL